MLYNIHTSLLRNKTVVAKLSPKLTHTLTLAILKATAITFIQDLPRMAQNLFC